MLDGEIAGLSTEKLQALYDTVGEVLLERIAQRNQELDALLVLLGRTKSPTANARRRRVARGASVSRKMPAASAAARDLALAR
jgi:hypothetical protein